MSGTARNVIVALMSEDDIIDSIAGTTVRKLLKDETFRASLRDALAQTVAAWHEGLEASSVLNDLADEGQRPSDRVRAPSPA